MVLFVIVFVISVLLMFGFFFMSKFLGGLVLILVKRLGFFKKATIFFKFFMMFFNLLMFFKVMFIVLFCFVFVWDCVNCIVWN